MSGRRMLAMSVGKDHLYVVVGSPMGQRLQVQRTLETSIPPTAGDDPQTRGGWLGETLRSEGLGGPKITYAVSRELLAFKRMTLPTQDPVELPEMTRLAMQRELPFDASAAVIDFHEASEADVGSEVVAVAMPGDAFEERRQLIKTARGTLEAMSPRAMGVAMLIGSMGLTPGTCVLAIDIGGESVEFSVVVDGVVRFSRAAEFSRNGTDPADTVVTETRRTWMSYRIVDDSQDIDRAIVLGQSELAQAVAERTQEILDVPTQVLQEHPLVEQPETDLGCCWPLVGLLLERHVRGSGAINFADPSRPPDVGARKRQLILAAVGLVVVGVLGLGLQARSELQSLRAQFETLDSQAREAIPKRLRHKRDVLKLEHLKQWEQVRVDWLEHLNHLATLTPDRSDLILDLWGGSVEFRGVKYDKDDGWSAPHRIRITVEGEARDRAVADQFRQTLVDSELYATSSAGADAQSGGKVLPFGFTYSLRSSEGVPPPADDPSQTEPSGEDAS